MPQQKNCFMQYRIRQRWKFDAGLETTASKIASKK
jgi:hypothetical protein